MQSTKSSVTNFLRISPSPLVLEDKDPFDKTNPAEPMGDKW